MRLTRMLLLLSVVSLLLVSCASNDSAADSFTVDPITSIEDLLPSEEISALPLSEVVRIRLGMEAIPIASCGPYYEGLIQDFLQEEELINVRGVTVEQDNLSVIRENNKKSLKNVILHIDLEMDSTKDVNSCDIALDVSDQIMDFLADDTFYKFKVAKCIVLTYDLNGYQIRSAERDLSSSLNEIVFREQSETEYAAQSIAFKYSEDNPEFVLNKFGAVPETGELHVEYYVTDDYFGRGEDVNKKAIDELESIGNSIKDYLLKESPIDDYITESDLKILTVTFRNGIFEWNESLDDFCLAFNYEV